MSELQVLTGVEIPFALPVIMAGVRTAAVATVATATLAAIIAGGGLGRLIVDGFALRNQGMLLTGALLVALLALVVDRGFTLLERRIVSPGIRLATAGRPAAESRAASAGEVGQAVP